MLFNVMLVVRSVYFYVTFVLFTLFFFLVAACVQACTNLTGKPLHGNGIHAVARAWSRTVFMCNPWWRLRIRGTEHLLSDGQAVVLVSNHQSNADILPLFCIPKQFRWLSKASVFKWPIIGTAMHWAGYIPINRASRSSHVAALEACASHLQSGTSVFFFPEGTRSETGAIRSFKLGAFKLACDGGVPVQPLVIEGAAQLLPKGSILPRQSHIDILVLPAVRPHDNESLEAFAHRVRELIVAAQATLRIERRHV